MLVRQLRHELFSVHAMRDLSDECKLRRNISDADVNGRALPRNARLDGSPTWARTRDLRINRTPLHRGFVALPTMSYAPMAWYYFPAIFLNSPYGRSVGVLQKYQNSNRMPGPIHYRAPAPPKDPVIRPMQGEGYITFPSWKPGPMATEIAESSGVRHTPLELDRATYSLILSPFAANVGASPIREARTAEARASANAA